MNSSTGPANPLDAFAGYRLRRVSSALMGLLGAELARMGLRPSEGAVLVLIAAQPRATQSGIGRTLGIQRANMAPLIAALERDGLVARERVNGRSQGLVLTARGQERAQAAEAAMQRNEALLEAAIPTGARAGFQAALAAALDELAAGRLG